ncbi:(2E,6E)-farnesyl diphosphate synthase [Thalassotalea sp. HSM 43]|uniref:(2E,6E)-farnesyl diphosphate synthase n=1 Tax=Thalassotalea sp. HSM 43 TaxID=2552945 RepID=UPI0010811F8E|nr:farnesyl diphosphate synthase [Thalassotalea sp. HSM 43]QBY03499.1 (2E,6E)-farnesyl diphosphate synthase [Thalassotalea sp. HSM 43]
MQLENLAHYQQRIDAYLQLQLDNLEINDQRLFDAMQYGLLIGGKRMRPYLAYVTANMLHLDLDDIDPIAAALECIHAYSLIHDDLPAMDDDDLRRGQATCHIKFDEATAILAGDALQSLAFDILANHSFSSISAQTHVNLMQQLSHATGYQGMCGGQAMDLAATGEQVSLSHLQTIHKLKTGALLKASILMPASCREDLPEQTFAGLQQFAEQIGLAYQVHDDIIDITSSEETLGKPAGSDLEANKSTYPSLLGLDGALKKEQQLFEQALTALTALPYNTRNLADFSTFIIKRAH